MKFQVLRLVISLCAVACSTTASQQAYLLYGVSTSASQIEGAWDVDGRSPSVLDTYYHEHPTADGAVTDDTCKSYYLWETDLQNIENLGVQFYRFSISWSRLLPTGIPDEVNPLAERYYSDLIAGLLARGIEPAITLFHFDLPQKLQDMGGWKSPDFPRWLTDYARIVFTLFGTQVKTWFTINEPLIACYSFDKQFDPANNNPLLCAKNMILAHASVYRMYQLEFKGLGGQLSIVNHLIWYEPDTDTEENNKLAEQALQYCAGLFSHPIYSKEGDWPEAIKELFRKDCGNNTLPAFSDEEIAFIRGTYDFYALNYYTARTIRRANLGETVGEWPFDGLPELDAVLQARPNWKNTSSSEYRIYPQGIRYQLNWLNEQYGDLKFVITENGYNGSPDQMEDDERIQFIQDHVEQVDLAIKEDGLYVSGYSTWTLMDDFEFGDGTKSAFGLYRVNFTDPDRARTARKSVSYYSKLSKCVPDGSIYRL